MRHYERELECEYVSRTYRNAIIFDGYVDEPTALGVPPYISPYPRYVAGALQANGVEFRYVTVDQWRRDPEAKEELRRLTPDSLLIVISGLTVPGHYRGGTPLTLNELLSILEESGGRKVVGGPIRHGYTLTGGTAALPTARVGENAVVQGDVEAYVADLASGDETPAPRMRTFSEIGSWAIAGAAVCRQHPGFPHVIAELETARGCERPFHCSFCTEGLLSSTEFRAADDVIGEVEALHRQGVLHYRLGKQPNLFAWPGRREETSYPLPPRWSGSTGEFERQRQASKPCTSTT